VKDARMAWDKFQSLHSIIFQAYALRISISIERSLYDRLRRARRLNWLSFSRQPANESTLGRLIHASRYVMERETEKGCTLPEVAVVCAKRDPPTTALTIRARFCDLLKIESQRRELGLATIDRRSTGGG
jgi:hypothetical protein